MILAGTGHRPNKLGGGTGNCINYAESQLKKIINLWDTYNGR